MTVSLDLKNAGISRYCNFTGLIISRYSAVMKRILVTGSNKGIGLAIVEALLCREDTAVILCSRDKSRGDAAKRQLLEAHPEYTDRLSAITLDVSSDDSVREAASLVAQSGQRLFGLVNNAGVYSQDIEELITTNYMGVRRVTEAFLPLLATDGRIVNVSSGSAPMFVAQCSPQKQHLFADFSAANDALLTMILTEYQGLYTSGGVAACDAAGYGTSGGYGFSKAILNIYTMIVAKQHPHLKVNACSPGMIKTDLLMNLGLIYGKTPDELGALPVSESVHSTIHLLFSEDVSSGQYYGSDGKRSPMARYRKPGSDPYDGSDGN